MAFYAFKWRYISIVEPLRYKKKIQSFYKIVYVGREKPSDLLIGIKYLSLKFDKH